MKSHQQLHQQNKIFWLNLVFTAESFNEPFEKVTIVTAKSEYIMKAREMALTQLLEHKKDFTDEDIDKLAFSFIENNKIQVYESVKIDEDGIFVCLDVDIIDDDVIWFALDKVYEAIEQGESLTSLIPLQYTLSELKLNLMKH